MRKSSTKKNKELKTETPEKLPAEAEKEGFYIRALDSSEAQDFQKAAETEGLDEEITLLRVKIKTLVEKDPENLELIIQAANILARLVKARYSMTRKQEKNLGEAIKNIIKDIGVPLGAAVISKKL